METVYTKIVVAIVFGLIIGISLGYFFQETIYYGFSEDGAIHEVSEKYFFDNNEGFGEDYFYKKDVFNTEVAYVASILTFAILCLIQFIPLLLKNETISQQKK